MHLVAGGWHLDCLCRFVPKVEEVIHNNLVSFAPEVIELEEEPEEDNSTPPSNEKNVAPVKGKDKGRKVITHASYQVSTRSFTKASVQHNVALATTVVGSPTVTPSAPAPGLVSTHSHSSATIPLVPRKRKVVAPDTSATFSERSSTISLVNNLTLWT